MVSLRFTTLFASPTSVGFKRLARLYYFLMVAALAGNLPHRSREHGFTHGRVWTVRLPSTTNIHGQHNGDCSFFRIALRVGLTDTAAVDRWVDSVIAVESSVTFPFTELAGASKRRREDVDDLLGQVTGQADFLVAGRMVLALLRRRLRDGTLTPDAAVKLAMEIARAGELTLEEYYRADHLDDDLYLAKSGIYGDLDTFRRKIAEFLDQYEKFDEQIPTAA
jgi:hypothetical protein